MMSCNISASTPTTGKHRSCRTRRWSAGCTCPPCSYPWKLPSFPICDDQNRPRNRPDWPTERLWAVLDEISKRLLFMSWRYRRGRLRHRVRVQWNGRKGPIPTPISTCLLSCSISPYPADLPQWPHRSLSTSSRSSNRPKPLSLLQPSSQCVLWTARNMFWLF